MGRSCRRRRSAHALLGETTLHGRRRDPRRDRSPLPRRRRSRASQHRVISSRQYALQPPGMSVTSSPPARSRSSSTARPVRPVSRRTLESLTAAQAVTNPPSSSRASSTASPRGGESDVEIADRNRDDGAIEEIPSESRRRRAGGQPRWLPSRRSAPLRPASRATYQTLGRTWYSLKGSPCPVARASARARVAWASASA